MSTKQKLPAETVSKWLRDQLGKHCLGGLTGQDWKALQAAAQIIHLYAYDGNKNVLQAFALVVSRMQRSQQELAYHAIAHVLDWPERDRIWLSLPALEPIASPRVCAWEPGGSERGGPC